MASSTGAPEHGHEDHGHQHGHDHAHDHGHDHHHYAQRNADFFDKMVQRPEAADSPWMRMWAETERNLLAWRGWLGLPEATRAGEEEGEEVAEASAGAGADAATTGGQRPLCILDYACGIGRASRALLPYAAQVVGMDVSPKSVALYNEWAAGNGVAPARMHAVQGNLMTMAEGERAAGGIGGVGGDGGSDLVGGDGGSGGFDLVYCGMALHHVGDPPVLVRRLAAELRPGGTLAIVDWNADGCTILPTHHHNNKDFVGHVISANGFSEEYVGRMFADAGLTDFETREMRGYTDVGVAAMFRGRKPE